MVEWIRQFRALPHTDVSIRSSDGLTLRGKYFEHKKGAPIEILFHGDADGYVPHSMSEENYRACAAKHKHLVLTPGADHGLCFPADTEAYFKEVRAFFEPLL